MLNIKYSCGLFVYCWGGRQETKIPKQELCLFHSLKFRNKWGQNLIRVSWIVEVFSSWFWWSVSETHQTLHPAPWISDRGFLRITLLSLYFPYVSYYFLNSLTLVLWSVQNLVSLGILYWSDTLSHFPNTFCRIINQ